MRTKVAVVTDMPAPYREGPFSAVAAIEGFDLRVYYCADREKDRTWTVSPRGYSFERLPGFTLGKESHFNLTIAQRLRAFQPDVVILGGYAYPTA